MPPSIVSFHERKEGEEHFEKWESEQEKIAENNLYKRKMDSRN